jgi:phenylpyruvate tautomerase PptA (4-oxalocrotonate tautomerase family)
MTVITVSSPSGRIDATQRETLAVTLTDAVLVPEIGQPLPAARIGFQVHFHELPPTHMSIGGQLLSRQNADILVVDVAVMDGDWPREVRAEVITRLFAALADALGLPAPSPTWWINFRVIEEGSWGSRGGVLSILDLLETGAFTAAKSAAIRTAQQQGAGQ